ncbi:MAG: glutamine-hydrolyzing GMP synthase [Oscillospiraceae bacterium]
MRQNGHDYVLIIDFGGQYNQLIARRVRECNVYCEVKSYKNITLDEIKELSPEGIIFTGGPNSVYGEGAPTIDKELFELGIPVLGICYGSQLMAHVLGGEVSTCVTSEYGKTETVYDKDCVLFSSIKDMPEKAVSWMSHTDYISKLPEGFKSVAHTDNCPVAAMANAEKKLYAVQFHPEVNHTEYGLSMLDSFVKNVCGCKGDWTMENYAETAIADIRKKVGSDKVLLALSGGVDSSVLAALLSKAVGKQLTCIFVDHGFMRKNEGDEVEAAFAGWEVNFIRVNAKDRYMAKLAGVSDPERKRKIIGEEFIRVFEDEASKLGEINYLAQGTIYPDVIESGSGDAAVIKSHHNVGGLPEDVNFKGIIEPLRMLFKDEVRKLGESLGLSDKLVWRQPFPGPGLAIRIMGEITDEKLTILQDADWIFREEIAKAGLDRSIGQYFAVLTNNRSVGVMGDFRTYDYTLALRAVTTTDFMTADFARIPYEVLEVCSARIVNEVKNINRVVYDVTTKPPATIEWE